MHVEPNPAQGAPCAEVAVLLGDTVLSVEHLDARVDPASRARATRLCAAAGALLLMISAVAFGLGVRIAADNDRARAAWIEEARGPVWEFRPARTPLAYDVLAFGGLFAGLAAIGFALWRARSAPPRGRFVIGEGAAVDAPVADMSAVELVRADAGGLFVDIPAAMRGRIGSGASAIDLPAGAAIPVPAAEPVRVERGALAFLIRAASGPRAALGSGARVDGRAAAFFAASALAHLALLAIFESIPPDPMTLVGDIGVEVRPPSRIESKPQEDPLREVSASAADGDREPGDMSVGASSMGAEGRAGDPSVASDGAHAIERTDDTVHLSRAEAMDRATDSGFLGDLKASRTFAHFASEYDFASGEYDVTILGQVDGAIGPGYGNFGTTFRGDGPGGGALVPGGTIGSKNYDTIGYDPRAGDAFHVSSGRPGDSGRTAKVPEPTLGTPTVVGDIDKELIRRYIRKKNARYRYCYEKALFTQPGLRGTVRLDFFISPQGAVLEASAEGVGDEAMHTCLADAVRSIEFPRGPAGARILYPIEFESH